MKSLLKSWLYFTFEFAFNYIVWYVSFWKKQCWCTQHMQNQIWLLSLKVCSITKELQWSNPNHEKATTRQVYYVQKQRKTRQQVRSNPKKSGWTQWLQLFFHLWRHLVMHSYSRVAHHFGWCKERFYSMDALFANNFANIHVIFSCKAPDPLRVQEGCQISNVDQGMEFGSNPKQSRPRFINKAIL